MLELNDENIKNVALACLFKDDEPDDNAVNGDGVGISLGLHPVRLAEKTQDIKDLLNQLPDSFRQPGGASVMDSLHNKGGKTWGSPQMADVLFCLGVAAQLAKWHMEQRPYPYYEIFESTPATLN